MIFVLPFLCLPGIALDAISCTIFELVFIETVEQIDSVTARAIAGHTAKGKTPRDKGSRHWLTTSMTWVFNRLGKRLPGSQSP